jgi:hypothetical protein
VIVAKYIWWGGYWESAAWYWIKVSAIPIFFTKINKKVAFFLDEIK